MSHESDDDLPLAQVKARRNSVEDSDSGASSDSMSDAPSIQNVPLKKEMTLFEYEWPNNRSGNYFVIESELAKFLDREEIPGVDTRSLSQDEWLYVTDTLGHTFESFKPLKAIAIEDAYQYMAETCPEKFLLYNKLVHQKEMEKLVIKQESQRINVIRGKIPHIMKRSLKETVRYNSQLNRERVEERQAYFDLQTQIIHLPQKKKKYDPTFKPQRSLYPLALIPGQFQDYYKKYTPSELRKLPINTLTESFIELKPPPPQPESKENTDESQKNTEKTKEIEKEDTKQKDDIQQINKDKDPFCGICTKGPETNKHGLPEKLIHCSQCENSGHPSCLDMNRQLVQVIKEYPWQCMECKTCTECSAPHDEEAIMFCDNCDRGYHSYCVGVKEIPKGRWVCERCGKCSSCLVQKPVAEGETGRWKNEMTKPSDGRESEFLQIHCHDCSKLFRKGSFCPVCLKVYRIEEDHINPMVMCDVCDRWVHTDCDDIDEDKYNKLSKDSHAPYTCILCRGDKEERLDTFHKKNR